MKEPDVPNRKPKRFNWPEELPVCARRDEIARAISDNQVVIVSGETGSGKTTQLPKICLSVGRGEYRLIGHTQPRRIAATSTASRIAQELESPLGDICGYKIRFTDKTNPGAAIKLMTDGILLSETVSDPLFSAYDTLIIDEAHERSLNIDFLLGYLKQILPKRPDLKVIITSATIDAERFAEHFSANGKPAPVIAVSGRTYPVELRYRPLLENPQDREARELADAVCDAFDELQREGRGDTLVFLPGEREIRETMDVLSRHVRVPVEILPLYARLPKAGQDRIFERTNALRIILATNVAETSVTVPGIRYVIDSGLARVKRYSYRNKVEQLHIENISQASAAQRSGRCGRTGPGIAIRLYGEDDFSKRPEFTSPEILRSSLAGVILRMKTLNLGDVDTFPFLEPPLKRAISDGYQLLYELNALDDDNRLTRTGRLLSHLPLDPRIARMIIAARDNNALTEVLVIASALSVTDPRERPPEAAAAADAAHKQFADPKSEFLSYLSLWRWFEEADKNKVSNSRLRNECRAKHLSWLRMREWRDVHAQLKTLVAERRWRFNETDATYEQIHLSLLAGLLGNVGLKSEEQNFFLGARSVKFLIWPGSNLAKKNGRWVMAAELVDTSRLFARTVAVIEPQWIEKVAGHLIRTSHSEPHWEKRAARVVAMERGTLYGIPVYTNRRIHYGPVDPALSHEIFVREALVYGHFDTRANFLRHNRALMKEIETLEHKSRRLDVLVDETLIAAWYDATVPQDITNGAAFESWYKEASKDNPKLLYLSKEELMRHEASGITTELFPKTLEMAGLSMALDYRLDPGGLRDGVTVTVPVYALNQIDPVRCEWLVPGMLKEKALMLIKSLPQRIRRHLVPMPEYAQAFTDRAVSSGVFGTTSLTEALTQDIRENTPAQVKLDDFRMAALGAHLFMNFCVVDEHGRMLDLSRDLSDLTASLGRTASDAFKEIAKKLKAPQPDGGQAKGSPAAGKKESRAQEQQTVTVTDGPVTSWSFGELPELLELKKGKDTLFGYPALIDCKDHCEISVFDDPETAKAAHRSGLARLFSIGVKDQIKFLAKNIPDITEMSMHFMKFGSREDLIEELLNASVGLCFLAEPLPANEKSFLERIEDGKKRISLMTREISRTVLDILLENAKITRRLPSVKAHSKAVSDISEQLSALLGPGFITAVPFERLKHFPRYLKGIGLRIDKLLADPSRDATVLATLEGARRDYLRVRKSLGEQAGANPKLTEYRWLLEELRVSLFAQQLKTPFPVSAKRLEKIWYSYGL